MKHRSLSNTDSIEEFEAISYYSSPQAPPPLPAGSNKTDLASIITTQHLNGSWILDSSFAQQVSKSLPELKSACPTKCKGAVASVWATVLALCLLRSHYSSQQDEWELIAMKAESWLKKQSLPAKVTLDQLFQEAKKIM